MKTNIGEELGDNISNHSSLADDSISDTSVNNLQVVTLMIVAKRRVSHDNRVTDSIKSIDKMYYEIRDQLAVIMKSIYAEHWR